MSQIVYQLCHTDFWHCLVGNIHSLPKLYTATEPEIAVELGIESYFETDNGARIGFGIVCALESTDVSVGQRSIHRIRCRVTAAWTEGLAL
jgi:hypothetical protein